MRVLLSYRRDDLHGHASALVGRIYDRLAAEYGAENVFMDVDTIPPGVDFVDYLGDAVARAEVVLAVVGPEWSKLMQERAGEPDDFVRLEVELAQQRAIPVVPLLVGGASMPKAAELPEALVWFVRRNAFVVDSGRDFNAHVSRLITDLERLGEMGGGVGEMDAPESLADGATAPVIAVEEVEPEEDVQDEGFELVSEAEVEEPIVPPAEPEASGDNAELPVKKEMDGLAAEPKDGRKIGLLLWLAVGAIAIVGTLGVWRPWDKGGETGGNGKPEPGQAYTNSLGMEMVWCPPGTFLMGSPDSEEDRIDNEEQHQVTLTKGFWVAVTEVTQNQWEKVMGSHPSYFLSFGLQAPVESVSWQEAIEFCRQLTEVERAAGNLPEGEEYTLPTEAQWEYACRAGTTGPINVEGASLEALGWHGGNSEFKPHPVGQKMPNSWGLYDMHGNVHEWCLDWYDEYPGGPVADPTGPIEGTENRVFRGGSYLSLAKLCRSAHRSRGSPDGSNNNLGFRLIRTFVRELEPRTGSSQSSIGTKKPKPDALTTARTGENFINRLGMDMVWCPPGTFLMGSPDSEEGRADDEEQHQVILTKGFWMSSKEVSQEEWRRLMGDDPSHFSGFGPIESVSWNDAMEFCRKLTKIERESGMLLDSREYTLPTEAQWEYACRAGTTGRYNVDGANLGDLAWWVQNSDDNFHPRGAKPHKPGEKRPNAWGLYDMHGNVCEWCLDWYGSYPAGTVSDPANVALPILDDYRVFRGGGFSDSEVHCRSAVRFKRPPGVSFKNLGFRIVLAPTRGGEAA